SGTPRCKDDDGAMIQLSVRQTMASALEHHRAGRLAEAEEIYRRILAQQPDNADALHLLGVIAAETNHHDSAVPLLMHAATLAPEHWEYWQDLGRSLGQLGRMEESVAARERAADLRPGDGQLRFEVGVALAFAAQHDRAVDHFERSIALGGGDDPAVVYFNLGVSRAALRQLAAAIAAYRHALALRPDYMKAWTNLGNALKDHGRIEESVEATSRALELSPGWPQW